jgi:hypothetical protein
MPCENVVDLFPHVQIYQMWKSTVLLLSRIEINIIAFQIREWNK